MIRRLTLALLLAGERDGDLEMSQSANFPPRMLEVVVNDARAAFAARTGKGA